MRNTKYESFSVKVYGSKLAALEATKRAVRSYQNAGYSTAYRYNDARKEYMFGYSYSKAVAYKVPKRVLGLHINTGV